jgi:hypothetical protein
MAQDGKYAILNVTKSLYVNDIHANSITLHDTTFRGNIHTSGKKIKELYEAQKNTNCFTDDDKHQSHVLAQNTEMCDSHVVFTKPVFFKLPRASTVDEDSIPDNSGCMCLDDNENIVYKIKKGGVVGYTALHFFEPQVKVTIHDAVLHIESS